MLINRLQLSCCYRIQAFAGTVHILWCQQLEWFCLPWIFFSIKFYRRGFEVNAKLCVLFKRNTADTMLKPLTGEVKNIILLQWHLPRDGLHSEASEQSVLEADVLEARKMGKCKDQSEFDKGQNVVARQLSQSISPVHWSVSTWSDPRRDRLWVMGARGSLIHVGSEGWSMWFRFFYLLSFLTSNIHE